MATHTSGRQLSKHRAFHTKYICQAESLRPMWGQESFLTYWCRHPPTSAPPSRSCHRLTPASAIIMPSCPPPSTPTVFIDREAPPLPTVGGAPRAGSADACTAADAPLLSPLRTPPRMQVHGLEMEDMCDLLRGLRKQAKRDVELLLPRPHGPGESASIPTTVLGQASTSQGSSRELPDIQYAIRCCERVLRSAYE